MVAHGNVVIAGFAAAALHQKLGLGSPASVSHNSKGVNLSAEPKVTSKFGPTIFCSARECATLLRLLCEYEFKNVTGSV